MLRRHADLPVGRPVVPAFEDRLVIREAVHVLLPKFRLLHRPQLSPPRDRRSCASPFSKSQSGVKLPLASVHDRVTLVGTRLLGCNAE